MDIQLNISSLSKHQLDQLHKDLKHSMPHKPVSISSKEHQLLVVNAAISHYINMARFINYMPAAVRNNFLGHNRIAIGACILHWHEKALKVGIGLKARSFTNAHTNLIMYDEYFKSVLTLAGYSIPEKQ